MESLTFDSHDVTQVEDFVSKMYSRMRIGAAGPRTHTRITRRVMTPQAAFDDLEYSFDVGFDAEPQPCLVLSDVLTHSVELDCDGGEQVFGAGDIFLICRPGLPYAGVVRRARLRQLTLDPAVLSRVVSSEQGDGEPVRMLDHRPVSRQAALNLRRAVAHVRQSVLAAPEPRSELVVSAASLYLASCVLDTFPNTAISAPTVTDRRDADPGTVRRAISFIESHPDIDMAVADIAAAACVTPRALQLAFRRHLDTTPMAYLRRVRLDRAREDLRAATPGDGQTVTAIADRWGFAKPGRFAELYHAAYGETPSQTLRR